MAQVVNAAVTDSGNRPAPAPFTSRFVEANGLQLHYLDYGGRAGATTMLCVHGGAAHGHWYDYVAPFFVPEYRVLSIDLRGHGESDWAGSPAYTYQHYASDLATVTERLDLRDFVLIGHSMGGMVSLVYSATHPGRVGKLVVVDTSIKLSEERLSSMRDRGSKPGSSYASKEELVTRYRMMPPGSTAPPEVLRHVAGYSAKQFPDGTWRHRFDRQVYAIREAMDGMPLWSRIKIPALLVKGSLSERITPEILAGARERCPHLEFAEVAGSNHHVTLDNPVGFVQAVKPFLARHR